MTDRCVLLLQGLNPQQIYHVTVMPCYDKKLEASRPDFYLEEDDTREVDCVITSGREDIKPLWQIVFKVCVCLCVFYVSKHIFKCTFSDVCFCLFHDRRSSEDARGRESVAQ